MDRYFIKFSTPSYRDNTPAKVERALISALGVIPEGVDEVAWSLNKYSTDHCYTVLLNSTMANRLQDRLPKVGIQSWILPHCYTINTEKGRLDISPDKYSKLVGTVRKQKSTAPKEAIAPVRAMSMTNMDEEGK